MRVSVYIATSLDGFIARTNGDIDWLDMATDKQGEEDYGYRAFIESVDYLVMGRNTFEKVLSFGAWPYGAKKVVVLSNRPLAVPGHLTGSVESMSGSPRAVTRRLAERGAKHLYVDGGKTVQGFLAEGLIDELIISRIPVLIGTGIPLFGPIPHDIPLRHIETRAFTGGLVQSRYEIVGISDGHRH